ncbi:MAG: hypothetical protein IJ559_02765 [Prevotella sp.]|nr:hypothetical protein [Prevotella sp.]
MHTPQGDITSAWRLMGDGHYEYEFTLPAGVTYSVDIPHLTNKDKVIIKQ